MVDNADVELPKLKYGYRTTPMTWDDLEKFIYVERDIHRLSRSESQQREYEQFKRRTLFEWKSMQDYVLCSILGVDSMMGNGVKLTNPDDLALKKDEGQFLLVKNDFPYSMSDGIRHYVLWKIGSDCNEDDYNRAKRQLAEQESGPLDFVAWENPPSLRSLPGIHHIHILCRRKLADSCKYHDTA
mgnify:CR=1 FL=1